MRSLLDLHVPQITCTCRDYRRSTGTCRSTCRPTYICTCTVLQIQSSLHIEVHVLYYSTGRSNTILNHQRKSEIARLCHVLKYYRTYSSYVDLLLVRRTTGSQSSTVHVVHVLLQYSSTSGTYLPVGTCSYYYVVHVTQAQLGTQQVVPTQVGTTTHYQVVVLVPSQVR